jgi:hypothetical protein
MRINSMRSLLGGNFKEGTVRHELSSAARGRDATVDGTINVFGKFPLTSSCGF